MRELLRRQTLFIASAHRTAGTPADYTVDVQDGLVRCGADEVLEVSLSQFLARATWLAVNDANRRLAFVDAASGARTEVALQAGNYTMRALAKALLAAYPAGLAEAKFLPQFAHLRLRFRAPHRLEFPSLEAAAFFGFARLATPTEPLTHLVESTEALNPAPVASVCVHLVNLHPLAAGNGMSAPGGCVRPTTLLMAVPVAAAPFCDIEYRNTADDFSMVVADRRIHRLHVRITDFAGAPVTFMPDHHLILTVSVYRTGDAGQRGLERAVQSLLELTRASFLRPLVQS